MNTYKCLYPFSSHTGTPRSIRNSALTATALSIVLACAGNAYASDKDYFEMSLDELVNIQITSVSKKSEAANEAAAASYIVTAEDIRRIGATSVPEALRIVPGLDVARIDANKWAISSRGFNRQHANKLLVLVDGRSVYTPMFSGVYWDEHDVPMDDIERIEVIRGPGASLWGSNAVNGIINIVTKNAKSTKGTQVNTTVGNEHYDTSVKHSGKYGNTDYRLYANYKDQGSFQRINSDTNANDGWNYARTGFRADTEISETKMLSTQASAYRGVEDFFLQVPTLTAPYSTSYTQDESFSGLNFLTKYADHYADDASYELQFYVDSVDRQHPLYGFNRTTYDFDYQHNFTLSDVHELTWGGGYRLMDEEAQSIQYLLYSPSNRMYDIISGFIQDKISLIKDKLFLTLGMKYEHNDFTLSEWQPNARVSWLVDSKNTLWAAVSRAVRTPTRNENDLNIRVLAFPPNTLAAGTPASFVVQGGRNKGFQSEELIAYEAGYKTSISENTSLDLAVFYNDYDRLRTFDLGSPYAYTEIGFPTHLAIPLTAHNYGYGESYGFELAMNHQLTKDLRILGSYSFIKMNLALNSGSRDTLFLAEEKRSPQHQFNVRAYYNIAENWEWDNMLYYVDDISRVDSYIRMDTRVGWKATKGLDLSVGVQNIFDDEHTEFNESTLSLPADIGRLYYISASVSF